MGTRTYSLDDVRDIIDCEGLGYAITTYLGYDNISDKELSALWREAELALNKVVDFLDENCPSMSEEEN